MRNKNNILLPDRLSTEDLTMTCTGDLKSCEALTLVTFGLELTCLDPSSTQIWASYVAICAATYAVIAVVISSFCWANIVMLNLKNLILFILIALTPLSNIK